MKKFTDKTDSLKEPAIKTANFVPRDAVNLGWFSSRDVSPENNMVITDLSSLIPENISESQTEEKLMFANQLGILEDENGFSKIESEDVYLSNIFVNEIAFSQNYQLESLKDKNYTMSYYTSRYFTLIESANYIQSNLGSFTEEIYIPNNIQVLDSNNEHYIDKETGRKKYRIELENFITQFNSQLNEIPSRILVFLEDPNPTNFTLQYDKVECDQDGRWSKQILKYTETINALPLFKKVQEESEVIDPFNSEEKIFSIKRSSKDQLIRRSSFIDESNEIFVNRKAVEDNRNFQLFNWRIIGRIKSAVNLNEINYGNAFRQGPSNDIKVGVLYSSSQSSVFNTQPDNPSYIQLLQKVNAYVFYNLQNSVLNLNGINFVNPNAETKDKSLASYWLVDLDKISDEDIQLYDAMVCSVFWKLSPEQANKIKRIEESYGSILLDVSLAQPDCITSLDPSVTISPPQTIAPSSITQVYNVQNNFINKNFTNGFDISIDEFAEDCGIYGYSKNRDNSYKSYPFFVNENLNSIIKINEKNILVSKRITSPGDSHKASNTIFSTSGLLNYANSIYAGSAAISIPNTGVSAVPVSSTSPISAYSDGPLKFLYNFVSVALNDKLESNRIVQDLNSTIHYFTTLWKNDWTLDDKALFEDEKEKYFTNQILNNESIFVKKVSDNPKQYYINQLQNVIPGIREAFLDQNSANIDLFIEYTNPNIGWTNTSEVTNQDLIDLASSYNVVKIINKTSSCNVYSKVKSNKFILPSDYGIHIIKDNRETLSSNAFSIRPSSQIKNYNFDLQLSHRKVALNDAPKYFSATALVNATVTFKQKRKVGRLIPVPTQSSGLPQEDPCGFGGQPVNFYPVGIGAYETSQESTSDQKLLKNIKDPRNVYSYTGDIDQGNVSSSFVIGKTGDYVRYIQFTLSCAGFKTTIDSNYGSATADAVRKFQTSRGILSDGVIDSQTKSYLGLFWSDLYKEDRDDYDGKFALVKNANVKKYITAATQTFLASDALGLEEPVRLINFTGVDQSNDPESIEFWVSFEITNDNCFTQLNSITVVPENFSPDATDYSGIEILECRFSDNKLYQVRINNARSTGKSKAPIEMQVNSKYPLGRYVSIKIKGSKLGGSFGSKAEGIAIKSIYYTVQTKALEPGTSTTPATGGERQQFIPTPTPVEVNVTGIVELSLPIDRISASLKPFSIDKNTLAAFGKLKSITVLEDQTETNASTEALLPPYTSLDVALNQTDYKPGLSLGRQEIVDLTNMSNITINGPVSLVSGTLKESGNSSSVSYPDNNITINFLPASPQQFTAIISTLVYSGPTSYVSPQSESRITNYRLKSAINGQIQPGSNTISFYDGPMLICNEDGSPYMINLSAIGASISSTASVFNSDIEVSSLIPETPGLKYGFYDNSIKQFIGTSISYYKYIQNAANIYVAVYAYDYDGNLETVSDFTSLDQDTVIPVEVPNKVAYPVYKLITSKTNKIQLMQTQKNLDKTQPWPLMITSGAFTKTIQIDNFYRRNKDWTSNYIGQNLIAKYDTSKSDSAAPSKIFGTKYYDIVDENPEIISRYSIKTKQNPIHYVHDISSDLERFVAPISPVISVYTREDLNQPWQKVEANKIKDVNCKTGVIKFFDPIISSDENLTKISYTIKLNAIMFKHSNGVPIPTNPFINRDEVRINKPLYIYLMPKEVYKYSTPSYNSIEIKTSLETELVTEYPYQSTVNFTYDNNIFNKVDRSNYNPFALLIGIVYVINNFRDEDFTFTDLRVKGGGVSGNFDTNQIISDIEESISYWDVYPPLAEAYPKGGYVIVKVPSHVKRNFTNPDEVYRIVRDNITAGIVFDLQDMDGKDWGSSVTIPA